MGSRSSNLFRLGQTSDQRPMDRLELCREISKLIAAMDRAWKEELGEPEAALTEIARRKTHHLLIQIKSDSGTLEGSLSEILGMPWLESHPWAPPYVCRIDAGLARLQDNP